MQGILKVCAGIDWINRWIGRVVAWCLLAAVLISAGNAFSRKFLSMSSNAWLEAQWYLFAVVVMLCAAWTLIEREHVRIDIVYNNWSTRTKGWIDFWGHLVFLLPACILIVIDAWPFFARSFAINESSTNAGGLLMWPAKFLIPLGFFFLGLQAASEAVKQYAIQKGILPDPFHGPKQDPSHP